jgi:hypothetical protein
MQIAPFILYCPVFYLHFPFTFAKHHATQTRRQPVAINVFTAAELSRHLSRRHHPFMLACLVLLLQLKPSHARTMCSQEPSAQRPRTCNMQSSTAAVPANNRQRKHRMVWGRNECHSTKLHDDKINERAQETAGRLTFSHANEIASALTSRLVKMFCFFAFMLQSKAHMQNMSG